MKNKKNILIIPPFNPYPLVSGGHQAVFNGIAILEGVANVFLMVEVTESQYKKGILNELQSALPFVTILPYIDPKSKHTIRWYWNVCLNKLYNSFPILRPSDRVESEVHKTSNSFIQSDLEPIYEIDRMKKNWILSKIQKHQIDIVQTEMISNLRTVEFLPESIKKIFVHHELKFVRDNLLLCTNKCNVQEILNRWEYNKSVEIDILNKYDHVVTLSQIDTEKLKNEGVTTDIITSLAVVADNKGEDMISPIRKVLTYIGPEMHYPNFEGVMWFLENCWNKLLSKDIEYKFQIIGKWSQPTAQLIESKYPNVKCLGFVDDLTNVLSGTTMIVPLNIGSGIRMKILEAAQYNIPVVTTSVGVEGLPLENNVHAIVADNPESFINGIIQLENQDIRDNFVKRTKDLIKSHYSIEKLKRSRINLYQ